MNSTIKTLAIAIAVGLTTSGAFAAASASDQASNYSSWNDVTSPNLGSGFGAWTIVDNNANPPYAGTYLDLATYGNPDAVVGGTPSQAWGVYANGGSGNGFIDLSRAFATDGSSASLNNQTFSVAFNSSSGPFAAGQSIGLSVGSAFSLGYAGGGADNMTLSVDGGAATPVTVDNAQLAAGISVALTVTGPLLSSTEGYSLVISPFAGGPALYTGTGTFDSSAFNTSSFTLANNNTPGNSYFNDLSIVPEPASMAMLGFAGLTSLLAIRRRK